MIAAGVDPGGRDTGIIIRQDTRLLAHSTVRRGDHEPLQAYLDRVINRLIDILDGIPDGTEGVDEPVLLAVEDVVPPTAHLGLTSVAGLIGTAATLGAVLAATADAAKTGEGVVIVVPPARHGQGPMAAYPAELRPSRGSGRGKDRLRHERSAWDCSMAGEQQWRAEQAAARVAQPALGAAGPGHDGSEVTS
jgi:hypothetical protein